MWRKGNPLALLVGMQTGAATVENSMEVPLKLKIGLPYYPAITLLGRYLPKGYKNTDLKGYVHPNVYSSTISNSLIMERAPMSINRWMDKEDVVYIYNGMLLGNEKEWNLATCSNVDGTGGYYAVWKKSVREREINAFTHMWNLRNLTKDHGGGEGGKKLEREGGKP